jgi:D-cysteine desulfhydrase
MTVTFPNRLPLANLPTPLMPLRRLSAEIGGPGIWIKRDDLTGSALSGNKVRKLEFSLAAAVDQGCNRVITVGGVQSNHCRATALLCAQLGLPCHLLLFGDEEPADGNLLLDQLAGATIEFLPSHPYKDAKHIVLKERHERYLEQGHRPYSIPEGASNGVGVWGYIAAAQELAADFDHHGIKPGHIVTATGSGGTQAGLTLGSRLFELDAQVWGVNVSREAQHFVDKVHADMRDWKQTYQQALDVDQLAVRVIDGYVGPGYAQATQEVFSLIRKMAGMEGIILDPVYTAKAFQGMLDQIIKGRFDDARDIVFVHTGGIFGLFPQRDQLFKNQNSATHRLGR